MKSSTKIQSLGFSLVFALVALAAFSSFQSKSSATENSKEGSDILNPAHCCKTK